MNQAAFTIYPPVMKGATSLLTSIEGLVPRAAAGDQNKFLTGGAVWTSVAAVADPSGHAGALLTTDGSTTSWTSLLVSGNSLKSAASANLTLGTTSFGTALTFTSATGAATFGSGGIVTIPTSINSPNFTGSGGVTFSNTSGITMDVGGTAGADAAVRFRTATYNGAALYVQEASGFLLLDGSGRDVRIRSTSLKFQVDTQLVGAGGSAPTSPTTGSNVFTSGIATNGPIFGATTLSLGTNATTNTVEIASSTAGSGIRMTNSAVGGPYLILDAINATLSNRFNGLILNSNGTQSWGLQMRGDAGLQVYDIVNAIKMVTFTPGAVGAGVTSINNTTPSTSTITGALTVGGGLGIAGAGFFGGAITTSSTVNASGSVNGTAMNVTAGANVVGVWQTSSASGPLFTIGSSNASGVTATIQPNGFTSGLFINFSGAAFAGTLGVSSVTEATTGGAGALTTSGGSFTTKTNISKHFSGYGTAPTGAVGAGAGTAPSAVTFDASANDASGIVSVTSGTLPTAAATVITVTFNGAYATAPHVVLYPNNSATALLSGATMVYTTATTTTFVITAGASGLVAATAYSWTYHVIQ